MEEDPMAVSKLYEAKGMQYVWMPTFDTRTHMPTFEMSGSWRLTVTGFVVQASIWMIRSLGVQIHTLS